MQSNGVPVVTCKSCLHWHALPVDPQNLGAPRQGRCQEFPHVVAIPQRQGLQIVTMYAQTEENFLACGRFKGKVAVVEGR